MESGPKRTKTVDTGKIMALYNAGWTGKKIAEEMGISEGTVWYHLKKMREEGKL